MTVLVRPYGGRLIDLMETREREALLESAKQLPSLQISERSVCDLELLATGAFSPLETFLGCPDYERVVQEMRLADGTLFPIPVTLPVQPSEALHLDREVVLHSPRNDILAVMTITDIYEWDRREAAVQVFGTTDQAHPIVAEMEQWGKVNISGPLRVLKVPTPPDFTALRHTPAAVRRMLEERGRANVVAFQTRNPLHRAHEELTRRAYESVDGVLLLHPVVGMTKPGDIDHFTRVRTYKALTEHYYPPDRIVLSLLPLAMRMAGPREAVWHAIIRRNYGASHFIVGRDHASPGIDSRGLPFYGPYDAQELLSRHAGALGITPVPFSEMVYLVDEDRYEETSRVPPDAEVRRISGTEVRDQYLSRGTLLPSWFTRPEIAAILREVYRPRSQQGFCVWFTGLSGAGKSTIAEVLVRLLMERGRQSTLLDGDVVRTHLSKGLGFSKEDRDTNILRIGFVAAEVARHGGAAICAAVSPYRLTRDAVRAMVGHDRFLEIFVDTPLEVCEARDVKGLYAKARAGAVENFTGISDPYEAPLSAELVADTVQHLPEENAREIVELLAARGLVQ